jgi:hypothetical protein
MRRLLPALLLLCGCDAILGIPDPHLAGPDAGGSIDVAEVSVDAEGVIDVAEGSIDAEGASDGGVLVDIDAGFVDLDAGPDARPSDAGPDARPTDAMLPDAFGDGDVEIQLIQDGSIPSGTRVTVRGVRVTASVKNGSGRVWVQESDTSNGYPYPHYAGVQVFFTSTEAQTVVLPLIGDCVDVTGTIGEFNSETELLAPTITASSGCGDFIVPFLVTPPLFLTVAADVDPGTTGSQPGPDAEKFEGVLVRLDNVVAQSATSQGYVVSPNLGATITTARVIFIHSLTISSTYDIIGIYGQFMNYQVNPRDAGDIILQ